MDFGEVHMLVSLSEMLSGHPHLSSIRQLVNEEIDKHREAADEEVRQLLLKKKAEEDEEAKKKAAADLKAAQAQAPEGPKPPDEEQSAARRDIYEGMPGPAEGALNG